MSKALNAVKDGYIRAVDWVVFHPHATIWLGTAALVVALVF